MVPVGAEKPEPIDVRLICATNLGRGQAGRRKPVPPGPALSHQHGGDRAAALARAARGYRRCCWSITPRIYSQKYNLPAKRLSARPDRQAERLVLARQCARPAPCGGTRRDPQRRRRAGAGGFPVCRNRNAGRNRPSTSPAWTRWKGRPLSRALEKHKNNVSRAAEALGLTRASLYRRMEKYGL